MLVCMYDIKKKKIMKNEIGLVDGICCLLNGSDRKHDNTSDDKDDWH